MRSILRSWRTKQCMILCLFVYMMMYLYPWGSDWKSWKKGFTKSSILKTGNRSEVVILMWTTYHSLKGNALMKYINKGRDYNKTCFDGVEITLDRGQLDRATAIVMHHVVGDLARNDLPKTRRADQLWVLYGTENPYYSQNLDSFNNLFNWTMTYRKDSDIFAPYGEYVGLDKEREVIEINGLSLDAFIAGKSGELAAVISNCDTPGYREDFLYELGKDGNMSVDVYGGCGKRICSWFSFRCDLAKWWVELGAKYKFYLAAENHICTDYITEKLWRSLEIGVVPVVYGGANYSQFAPPHSYINVKDFKTVKDVANYLKRVGADEIEYKKYFEWRKKYKVKMGDTWQGWCDLSKRVKKFREEVDKDPLVLQKLSRTINDLSGWWDHDAGRKNRACGGTVI